MAEQAYVPGVCNINRQEIASRRNTGYVGLGMLLLVATTLVLTNAAWPLRVIVFIPAFITYVGFLQAGQKFCAAYGSAGMQNVADGSTNPQPVNDDEAKQKDKAKSRKIYLQSLSLSLLTTAVVTLI